MIDALLELVVLLDELTMDAIVALRDPLVTKMMTSVTGLGSATAALVLLGLFALAGWHEDAVLAAGALTIAGVIVGALMIGVQRPFPQDPVCLRAGEQLAAHSFPSGHAAAVTVYAMVARRSNHIPFLPVALLATAVSVSRIYLGTHYLSDTVTGIAIGVLAFLVARRVLRERAFATRLVAVLAG